MPNALVAASLDIGTLILTLAGLSFLGLGQAAPAPELGADSARNHELLPAAMDSGHARTRGARAGPGRQHLRRLPAQSHEDDVGRQSGDERVKKKVGESMKTFVVSRLGSMVAILVALTAVMFVLQNISPLDR